ncbi:MAG: helix-turn-helix transcriptional regulator [Firmicutes bacterium]|nr:helix-turn-helix transcriptional regulator [Bacillota bacterium]
MKHEYVDRYRELGLRVSLLRKIKGYTQEQLAERAGKSLTFIGSIEAPNMPTSVSLETIFDIANALEMPVYQLFLFENDIKP